jgi:hypothetical protein
MLRLPNRNEVAIAAVALLVLLFASWLRRGEKIASLESQLAAKPRVEFRDKIVEKRVVVKGPVHTVTVLAKDGSKTTTTDRAPETVSTDKAKDAIRVETPICPPTHRQTRYAGLIFGADGYGGSWVKGFRGGINVFENWDLGGNVLRERSGETVLGGEVVLRW